MWLTDSFLVTIFWQLEGSSAQTPEIMCGGDNQVWAMWRVHSHMAGTQVWIRHSHVGYVGVLFCVAGAHVWRVHLHMEDIHVWAMLKIHSNVAGTDVWRVHSCVAGTNM